MIFNYQKVIVAKQIFSPMTLLLECILKSRDISLLTKACIDYGFSSCHVWM